MRMQSLIEKLSRLLMKRSQKMLYPYSVTKDLETCGKVWFNGCRIDWVRSLIFRIKISFLWLNEDRNVWPLSLPNLTRIIMSLTSLKIGSLKYDPRWNDGHVEMSCHLWEGVQTKKMPCISVFFRGDVAESELGSCHRH